MTTLSENLARLAAVKAGPGTNTDRHTAAPRPSSNPGALTARAYLPPNLAPNAPLVVVLHGCTQNAAGYDHGTGWSTLADRQGFALLFPEQTRANNPNLCFNWFLPDDIARRGGEAESIASMAEAMVQTHRLDPARVFVTGLSAGGAMAAVMLATYPDHFAGGAVIGGLPYACAPDIPEALRQMRQRQTGDEPELSQAVARAAGSYRGPWPTLSIWHGTADTTVTVSNMERLGRQWRHLHQLSTATPTITTERGTEHRIWRGEDGRVLVEERAITGMGHGVPIDPSGPDRLGASGPYMLDVGVPSTALIAQGWVLTERTEAALAPRAKETKTAQAIAPRVRRLERIDTPKPPLGQPSSIQQTIERALRSAGLML